MKNVLIVFGGRSVEHEISIITGLGVVENLSKEFNKIVVYIDKQNRWWFGEKLKTISTYKQWSTKGLKRCAVLPESGGLSVFGGLSRKIIPIYCAINCLHGRNGEDGAIQGVFQLGAIPSTSSSSLSSAITMNKHITKRLLKSAGIKVLEDCLITKDEFFEGKCNVLDGVEAKIGYPCVVKPNSLGSSVGVNVSNSREECEKGINYALSFDSEVIVEKYITPLRELNVAVFKGEDFVVSNVEEVYFDKEVYDFSNKYLNKNAKREVPAKLTKTLHQKINNWAILCYKELKCEGIVRIDFLLSGNELFVNEVNSIPGSLACYLWKEPKIPYKKLLNLLIDNSVKLFEKQKNFCYNWDSDVLKNLEQNNFVMSK